jgi:hypothetical protein
MEVVGGITECSLGDGLHETLARQKSKRSE